MMTEKHWSDHVFFPTGYFSLNVPSGLTLYWFVNNLLSTAQQVCSRPLADQCRNLSEEFHSSTCKEDCSQGDRSMQVRFTSCSVCCNDGHNSRAPPVKQ